MHHASTRFQNEGGSKVPLTTLELPFAYLEHGESKSALVKVVLCGRCVKKLMWKRTKEKEKVSALIQDSRSPGNGDSKDTNQEDEEIEKQRRKKRSRDEKEEKERSSRKRKGSRSRSPRRQRERSIVR